MGVKISNWWRTWSWLVIPDKDQQEQEGEGEEEGERIQEKSLSGIVLFPLLE